jgi:hypothetical protein
MKPGYGSGRQCGGSDAADSKVGKVNDTAGGWNLRLFSSISAAQMFQGIEKPVKHRHRAFYGFRVGSLGEFRHRFTLDEFGQQTALLLKNTEQDKTCGVPIGGADHTIKQGFYETAIAIEAGFEPCRSNLPRAIHKKRLDGLVSIPLGGRVCGHMYSYTCLILPSNGRTANGSGLKLST